MPSAYKRPTCGTVKYTPHIGGGPGTALAELYTEPAAEPATRLVNLAVRASLRAGEPGIVAGFRVAGAGEKQVLIRVAGPALSKFDAGNVLPDPQLKLIGPWGQIAGNNDWHLDAFAGFAAVAARRVGAFDFPVNSADAAVLRSLEPGNYNVIADSADGRSGIVLIEIYEVTQ